MRDTALVLCFFLKDSWNLATFIISINVAASYLSKVTVYC